MIYHRVNRTALEEDGNISTGEAAIFFQPFIARENYDGDSFSRLIHRDDDNLATAFNIGFFLIPISALPLRRWKKRPVG